MSGPKTATFITVNWNGGNALRTFYKSFAEQEDVSRFRFILSDNGSSDGSVAMVRDEFPFVEIVENGENIGFGAGNNRALPMVDTDYVIFANPDMEFTQTGIDTLLAVFDNDPQCGAVGPMVLNGDGSFMPQCRRGYPDPLTSLYYAAGLDRLFPGNRAFNRYLHTQVPPEEAMEVDALSGSFFAARTQAVRDAGGFDEAYFLFVEEVDLFLRMRQQGWRVRYEPVMKVTHHGGVCFEQQPRRSLFYHFHMTRSHIILWAKERALHDRKMRYHVAFALTLLRYALISAIQLNGRFFTQAAELWRLHRQEHTKEGGQAE